MKKKMYYIIFNNCEGSFPQKFSETFNKQEVVEEVKKLNGQLDNPYAYWSIGEKMVEVK